jgi:glycosyltransferase involved in cell wall biosynthesis
MRLAWFSPVPPIHSGIAAYSLDALGGVAQTHAVDVYVEDAVWRAAGGHLHAGEGPTFRPQKTAEGHALYRAFDFPTRQAGRPYDLIVYQLGNAACHAYMWPYLLRWPGLVVLHDGALHHARAQALLRDGRADDYRAEFGYNHPGVDPRVADYVIAGLEGSPYYLWPMLRLVLERARAVAVHSTRLLEVLREEFPATPLAHISMGVEAPRPGGQRPLGSPTPAPPGVTFAAFGLITPEKRIPQVLAALADLRAEVPGVRLRLIGENAAHYALWQDVARCGVADLVEVTGYVNEAQLDAELLAADVCLCLRWPTAHETSASWLRCLAAGRATIITDQLTTVDVPTLDPRHWQLRHTREDAASVFQPPADSSAVAVSIETADEVHMLRQAMRRLAVDAMLRDALGTQARLWWQAHHTMARMHRDYARVLDWAAAQPEPQPSSSLPTHVLPDPAAFARSLLAPFDVHVDILGR